MLAFRKIPRLPDSLRCPLLKTIFMIGTFGKSALRDIFDCWEKKPETSATQGSFHNSTLYIGITRGVTRGGKGDAIPRALNHWGGVEWLRGAPNSPNNITSTFFNEVHLLPRDLRFEHGDAKLVSCPGRHLTSLRPWVSPLRKVNIRPASIDREELQFMWKLKTKNFLIFAALKKIHVTQIPYMLKNKSELFVAL